MMEGGTETDSLPEKPLDDKPLSVVTDAGRSYSGKRKKSKQRSLRFPTGKKPQCVHSLSERSQL